MYVGGWIIILFPRSIILLTLPRLRHQKNIGNRASARMAVHAHRLIEFRLLLRSFWNYCGGMWNAPFELWES